MKFNGLIPKYFYVTVGKGLSDVSKLNAFDRALIDAGIGQCNLVTVSSILPRNAIEISPVKIPAGTITFVVMARMHGTKNETISAGIAWGMARQVNGDLGYGFVVEGEGNCDRNELEDALRRKIGDMAKARNMKLESVKMKIVDLTISKARYGCVVAALVFVPSDIVSI